MADEPELDKIRKGLEYHLRVHGHGFQYAALAEIERAREEEGEKKSLWIREVAEFPVEVQGAGTRVDFILTLGGHPYWMLVECKRANPALKNWCFVKAPFVRRRGDTERYLAEGIGFESRAGRNVLTSYHVRLHTFQKWEPVAHLSVELKTNEKGEGRTDEIQQAADQIMKGMNGIAEVVRGNDQLIASTKHKILLPVIFTTARLFFCDADLSQTELLSGNIDIGSSNIVEHDWIFLQHPVSVGFQHQIPNKPPDSLSAQLETEFLRTIPIVNAGKISAFLLAMNNEWFDPRFPTDAYEW